MAPKKICPLGVSETQTCPGWGPNISETTLWNPDKELDKVGWDLAIEELWLGRTCLV
jgi:hypothetical protein